MNLPDKNPIWETFADNYDEKVKILYSLNEYEMAIKPLVEILEAELNKYIEIKDVLFTKIDKINMKNCDFKLQIEHLLRVNKKHSAQFSFVTDQLKGEQNENAQLKVKIEQLEIEKIELNANFERIVKGQRDTIVLFKKDEVELRAENKRLREALRPFAEAFEPRTNVDQDDEIQRAFDRNSCTPQMTMGDFRKAAEVLEGEVKAW